MPEKSNTSGELVLAGCPAMLDTGLEPATFALRERCSTN